MSTVRRSIVFLVAGVAACALLVLPAEACPSCKAALAAADDGGNLVNGMFYSIMFMLSMPFLIVGGFSLAAYRAVARARRAQAAASGASAAAAAPPAREAELVEA